MAGPLRKWVLPEEHQYIAFIHLPLLAAVYALAVLSGRWPRMSFLFVASGVMAAATVIIAVIQTTQDAIVVPGLAISAWIGYFAYIPLCFIVSENYSRDDTKNFAVINLFFMMTNAAIMYLQKDYSAEDAINQGFGESPDQVFLGLHLVDDLTRPMGIFTSPLANSVFISFSIGLFWMLFLAAGHTMKRRGTFFWVAMVVSVACLILSGSRYAVFSFGLMVGATILSAVFSDRTALSRRDLAQTALVLAVAVGIGLATLGNSLDVLTQRFGSAWEEERDVYQSGTLSRLFLETDIYEILDNMDDTPFLGHGLGTGSNAAYILGEIPERLYRESPWAKHMNDVGLFFASFYIILRFAFLAHAGKRALRRLRSGGDAAAIVFLSQLGIQILVGQTVSHVVIGPLTWLYFGILLAWLAQSDGQTGLVRMSR